MRSDRSARDLHPGEVSFLLAEWTVRPRSNELIRSGEVVRIERKPMEVLVHLAARAGETVTREELLEVVWPGVFVTENAVSRCVSQLRKLLEDDARTPRVIETIPTVGYRLIAPVTFEPEDPGPTWALPSGVSSDGATLDVSFPSPSGMPPAGESDRAAHAAPARHRGWAVAAGLLLLVLIGAVVWRWSPAPRPMPGPTRPLTSEPGVEQAAALSPDGSRVAYVHVGADRQPRLFVRGIGDDRALALTPEGVVALSPAWMPGGNRIAFARCDSAGCALYTVSALGGEARRLSDVPIQPPRFSIAPDGETVAVAVRDGPDAPTALDLLDLQTGERRRLTSPPPGSAGDADPAFSPDGTALAFVRDGGRGSPDLYVVPVGGGEPRRLTTDGRALAGHSWSADGRSLLFSSNRTGMYELWRVPARGGPVERVTGIAARDPGRPVAGAGRLVFEEWAFDVNLWEAPADGAAEPVRRVASTWWDKHPHLSPDGARVVFISNRTGPPEVWVANRDGSNATRLTEFGGASVEAPRWAPDGRHVVFQARPDTQADLFVIDTDGGPPKRLTATEADEVAPRWSRDGRSVYFGSNRGGRWRVWRLPLEGGEAAPLADGYTAEESADGAHLLYTKRGEPGLWARPLAGGAERRLTDALAPADWGSWAVTDASVLALHRTGAEVQVLRLDPETGKVEPLPLVLGEVMPMEPGLTATADGRRIFFARVDEVGADLMLVEGFE